MGERVESAVGMNLPTAASNEIILVGGGGHASVCLDVLRAQGRIVVGYTSPSATDIGLAHLGSDEDVLTPSNASHEILVAIGDNRTRLTLLNRLRSFGFVATTAIHPNAVVAPSASIGPGSVLMAGTVVNARAVVGIGSIINTAATVDHDCLIGDGAHVAPGTHLAGNVNIGEGTFLGVGVSVIPRCRIGSWSVVGAGAAVISDLAERGTYAGVPAAPVR